MVLVVKKNIVTERYPTSVNLGRSQLVLGSIECFTFKVLWLISMKRSINTLVLLYVQSIHN